MGRGRIATRVEGRRQMTLEELHDLFDGATLDIGAAMRWIPPENYEAVSAAEIADQLDDVGDALANLGLAQRMVISRILEERRHAERYHLGHPRDAVTMTTHA
jgi:hypothetical protein